MIAAVVQTLSLVSTVGSHCTTASCRNGSRGKLETDGERTGGERAGLSSSAPAGTFLKVPDALKARIAADLDVTELASLAEVMHDQKISRGVALRAFDVLRQEGVAEPAPGERWRVARSGTQVDRRPLDQRIADVITAEGLDVGDAYSGSTCPRSWRSSGTPRPAGT